MMDFSCLEARDAIDTEMPWDARDVPKTIYARLNKTAAAFPEHKAFSYQITSGPKDKAETLSWREVLFKTTQAANMFRAHGIGEKDVVAYILPNAKETVVTYVGPNPAPGVKTVFEVDLLHYLTPPKSWIVPLIRPKNPDAVAHHADLLDFSKELAKYPGDALSFEDVQGDRVAAYFHTGGTTGMPKVAQHKYSGMMYNGWLGANLLFDENSNIMCPLPMFHVFACHVIMMAQLASGAHGVYPTPQGYRGEGVFDNFWKLCERYKITFMITVPTALSALMQRPVDADISSIQTAFSGSSPLPVELFRRFEEASGVEIIEGYGLTEATCLVSCNPVGGEKKIGSVGIPFPYSNVKILRQTPQGPVECAIDEVGEICIDSPGVFEGSTYTETDKNHDLFHHDIYLRTGDLGRIDADGYLFITGRAKDLIIRGGHNIDPAEIEEALAGHEAVAFVGAIGQPDAHSGEIPCAYVELVDGAEITTEELLKYSLIHVHERAAVPKYIEIVDELPKTAVGKVFKPDLRKSAITRVYNAALEKAGLPALVTSVTDDKKRGLVAQLDPAGKADAAQVSNILGQFTRPWAWLG